MNRLLDLAAQYARRYLDALPERPVAPTHTALAALEQLRGPLPEDPDDPAAVLERLDRLASPATMAMAGPRFFGFVSGGSLPVALAANWLAGAWNQNSGYHHVTPATAVLEQVALDWLLELLDLPRDCAGSFVTDATLANFTALAAARHALLARAGWDVEADGLFGAPPITVVVGEEAHPTVLKALALLGLGRERLLRVPVDGQGRMRADALPPLPERAIVCTQVGNVNTGACDPVAAICDQAHASDAWVHVDGAFGLWARAAPAHAHLLAGVEWADSWAVDAHKWLNVPYDSGLALVRDAAALRAAMAISAAYLPGDSPHRNPADYTPELSRRARGVEIWAVLATLGRSGVAALIERSCRQARRFAEVLGGAGYRILNEVVLNQVLVSFGDDDTTRRVIAAIQEDGTAWCSGTLWQGHTAMRISVCCWATRDEDVERSLASMLRLAAQARAR
ncbi:MAG TPA: pyridoxal-dependent decarboxylase [Candidatus Competibacteraceae bacterium]|nr:pyridoxal-dependent decarboxylase [Candidatus Competibacteraceae bacterium]